MLPNFLVHQEAQITTQSYIAKASLVDGHPMIQYKHHLTCLPNCFKKRKLLPYGSAGVQNCTNRDAPIVVAVVRRSGDNVLSFRDEELKENLWLIFSRRSLLFLAACRLYIL